MSHLDEGQLHALLDGELEESERHTAEAHLATCEECRRLFAEAKSFLEEADALIAAVDLPSEAIPRLAPSPRLRARRFPWRGVAWAASLVLAAGLGWYSSELRLRRPTEEAAGARAAQPAALPAPAVDQAQSPPLAESKAVRTRSDSPAASGRLERVAPAPAAARLAQRPEEKLNRAERESVVARTMNEASAGAPAAAAQPPAPAVQLSPGSVVPPGEGFAAADRATLTPQATPFRQIKLEEAVRSLAGNVRLIDGFAPVRVLMAPGSLVPGADPDHDLIRVVYQDPPGPEVWLDQQRGVAPGAEAVSRPARRQAGIQSAETLSTSNPDGSRSLRWVDQDGFRLTLTGFLPVDSLRSLLRRVK